MFSPFIRCAAIHGPHSNLPAAAACYNKIASDIDGDMPLWKHTGKHVHVVGAVDRHGSQRAFSDREKGHALTLGLAAEAVLTEQESITTFYNIAKMFYESSRLIPISSISLEGMFDYEARDKHYWSTEAGMGQAFTFAQQVVFTLELSLKALLEYSGRLLIVPEDDWQTHDLVDLFKLLDEPDKELLNQRWNSLPLSECQSHRSLSGLLRKTRRHYMDWRYIPTLKSTELSMDVIAMLSASRLTLDLAERSFRENTPLRIEVNSQAHPPAENNDPALVPHPVWVRGLVQSVKMPEGFDPNSQVEVVVQPEFYYSGLSEIDFRQDVTVRFRKSQVESYYGLERENVSLVGRSTESERHILNAASHMDILTIKRSYTLEPRVLRGTVYNLIPSEDPPARTPRITLVLSDSTYYTSVDCMFVTDSERETLAEVHPGDEITIRGHATLINGRPVSLVGPEILNH